MISGTVLEVGSGEGYGISSRSGTLYAVDKYKTANSDELKSAHNITFIQTEAPPLKGIKDNSIDFVVTFK